MTAPGRAAEDYLEALLLLERELGEAHGAELARRMGGFQGKRERRHEAA